MAEVRPQRVPSSANKTSKRELYATVCYYYPRYTLQQAKALPARDLVLLLKVARKQQGAYLYNLTQIAQAPHSKKQANVKKLLDQFKKQAGK